MKTFIGAVLTALMILGLQNPASANDRAIDGLLLGAGGGALLGQAIGRNTESTLIGTAIGGMVGYMVGNEHDRNRVVVSHVNSPRRVVSRKHVVHNRYQGKRGRGWAKNHKSWNRHNRRVVYRVTHIYNYPARDRRLQVRNGEPICREAEVLATIDGRAETLYTTVCLEGGEWVIPDDSRSLTRRYDDRESVHRNSYSRQDRLYYRSSW